MRSDMVIDGPATLDFIAAQLELMLDLQRETRADSADLISRLTSIAGRAALFLRDVATARPFRDHQWTAQRQRKQGLARDARGSRGERRGNPCKRRDD